MRMLLSVLLLGVATLALAACSGPKPNRADRPELSSIAGRSWTAIQLNGKDIPTEPAKITIEFMEDSRIGGFAGVNRYFGGYSSPRPGSVSFSGVGSTKMAGPPDAMQRETEFFNALSAADGYRVRGAILDLLAGDRVLVRFRY